jgi:predicted small integral membrane protein
MGWRTTPAAFYAAVAAGVAGTLVWQYVLQSPAQIQGFVVGTLLNLVVFTLATRFGALPAAQPARSGGE